MSQMKYQCIRDGETLEQMETAIWQKASQDAAEKSRLLVTTFTFSRFPWMKSIIAGVVSGIFLTIISFFLIVSLIIYANIADEAIIEILKQLISKLEK